MNAHPVSRSERKEHGARTRSNLRRSAKVIRGLSWGVLVLTVLATVVLWCISEKTWWGTLFTFCPRHPFLVPPIVLLSVSVFAHRPSLVVNIISLAVVVGPLMGGRIPFRSLLRSDDTGAIGIVSCNVQGFQPGFETLLLEILQLQPDVVALQEAPCDCELCKRYFAGWHTIHEANSWIGSRFPMQKLGARRSALRPYDTVLSVCLYPPSGPFVMHVVHLMTPRRGLTKLSFESTFDGSGPTEVEDSTRFRMQESREARQFVARLDSGLPTVIAGDFNMPTSSNLYRDCWDTFTNAFDEVGAGFGYTAPCSKHHYWFDDVPWVRIDHILADGDWTARACHTGSGQGSDHRLIWAKLQRRQCRSRTPLSSDF